MATITFSAGTVIPSTWLNDVNALVYGSASPPSNPIQVSTTGAVTIRPTAGTGLTIGDTTTARTLLVAGNLTYSIGQVISPNWGELLSSASSGLAFGTTSNVPVQFYTNSTVRMAITAAGLITDSAGLELGFKTIPRTTSIVTVASQKGKRVALTAGVTVTYSDGWAVGDYFSIYNDSAAPITITAGSSTTLRLAGTATTGNRTIAQRGVMNLWVNATNEFICDGMGVT